MQGAAALSGVDQHLYVRMQAKQRDQIQTMLPEQWSYYVDCMAYLMHCLPPPTRRDERAWGGNHFDAVLRSES